ncbi:MAG TPA: 5-(carboxyamino)imidazole ribonucleotide mutase [Candidatus Nitrosocosmicus sp.]
MVTTVKTKGQEIDDNSITWMFFCVRWPTTSQHILNIEIKQILILSSVSIIMGSDSDLSIMKDAAEILTDFNIPFEIKIVSAHRTPEFMFDYAQKAEQRGIKVIIAGAGGSAHLPGMVASLTSLPVIGVPIKSRTSINGIDSLLSIVQMPPGIPVATMAINGSKNAAILASSILGIYSNEISSKVKEFKKQMQQKILEKDRKLELSGFREYQINP